MACDEGRAVFFNVVERWCWLPAPGASTSTSRSVMERADGARQDRSEVAVSIGER